MIISIIVLIIQINLIFRRVKGRSEAVVRRMTKQ